MVIAIYLSKQQVTDANPKLIKEINFIANLQREGTKTIFFKTEEKKVTNFHFSRKNVWVF